MAESVSPRRRVIVAGAVAWTDQAAIERALAAFPADTIVIHGDAPGCDMLAGQAAAALGMTVVPMAKSRADAQRYPGAAWQGLNERMLACGADTVLVFHPALAASRGSAHLVACAQAAGIAVQIIAESAT